MDAEKIFQCSVTSRLQLSSSIIVIFFLLGFTNKMQVNFTLLGPGDKKIQTDTIGIYDVLLSLSTGRVADTRPCSPHLCSCI